MAELRKLALSVICFVTVIFTITPVISQSSDERSTTINPTSSVAVTSLPVYRTDAIPTPTSVSVVSPHLSDITPTVSQVFSSDTEQLKTINPSSSVAVTSPPIYWTHAIPTPTAASVLSPHLSDVIPTVSQVFSSDKEQSTSIHPSSSVLVTSLPIYSTEYAIPTPTASSVVSTPDVTATVPQVSTTATEAPCYDRLPDCAVSYGQDVCTDFRGWAEDNCAAFCGFCTEVTTVTECIDLDSSCSGYGQSACVSPQFRPFMMANCRLFCGFCDPGTTASTQPSSTIEATTPVFICRDLAEGCESHDKSICNSTEYATWAEVNCAAYCGFCIAFRDVGGQIVGGMTCPVWNLPTECNLVSYCPDVCPLPVCPGEGYTFAIEKLSMFDVNTASNA